MVTDNQRALSALETTYNQANAPNLSSELFSLAIIDFVEQYENNPSLRVIDASVVAKHNIQQELFAYSNQFLRFSQKVTH